MRQATLCTNHTWIRRMSLPTSCFSWWKPSSSMCAAAAREAAALSVMTADMAFPSSPTWTEQCLTKLQSGRHELQQDFTMLSHHCTGCLWCVEPLSHSGGIIMLLASEGLLLRLSCVLLRSSYDSCCMVPPARVLLTGTCTVASAKRTTWWCLTIRLCCWLGVHMSTCKW